MKPFESNNIMLDIETLDTRTSAVVLSIGMCKFDPVKQEITDRYYQVLSSIDQTEMLRTVNGDTIEWWATQPEAARIVLDESREADEDTHVHLMRMGEWIGADAHVWGNGPSFDNAIVKSLFDTYGVPLPWPFKNDRCYRTLCALGQRAMTPMLYAKRPMPEPEGIAHNALDDAVYQARVAMRYMKVL